MGYKLLEWIYIILFCIGLSILITSIVLLNVKLNYPAEYNDFYNHVLNLWGKIK